MSEDLPAEVEEFVDEEVCSPITDLDQLLNFRELHSIGWFTLVEPIVERSQPRNLESGYHKFDSDDTNQVPEENQRPELLVCHDYKNNYRDDKFISTGSKKYEEYRFYNWSCVDIFCYFSHNFVTIPTLQFLNSAHRNGVKVLGTIIVEGNTGVNLLNQILTTLENVTKVADELVDICRLFKFEGWLLNIETPVIASKIPLLQYFVEYLSDKTHELVPFGKIIWYDSVTKDGKLHWQNELNALNEMFFDACDGIFLNYGWGVRQLIKTNSMIETKYPKRRKDVYFGIDVFGRGQKAEFATNETFAEAFAFKFSVAIFACGWTHECMKMSENSAMSHRELCDKTNSLFLERDEVFWNSLWSFQFSFGPKLLPFYTSFCIGSGKQKYRMGMSVNTEPWFNLRKQSFQSSTPPASGIFSFCFKDAFDGGTCLKLESDQSTRLFVCEFDCQQDIILSYAFKTGQYLEQQADLEVLLKVKDEDSKKNVTVVCGAKNDFQNIDLIFNQNLSANNMRILTTNIEVSKEIKLPGIAEINGWKIRYHYLKFESSTKLITDIGVKKIGPQSSELLIGAISVVKGLSNKDEMLHIPYIEF